MTTSSTPPREPDRGHWRLTRRLVALVFWLGVWQVAATAIGSDVLLVGPAQVAQRLVELVPGGEFWVPVLRTTGRITAGFGLAALLGVVTAAVSARSRWLEAIIGPAVVAIRSTPVVSFIILVLIWADSARLATIISFLMALPIVHATVYQGIRQRDRSLLEMAAVFRVPRWRRMLAIDVPAVLPYFVAACRTGVGLAWKSGIAAEVIGLPSGTVGEQLYQAKILLVTSDVLAWTVVVVVVAYLVEQVVVRLLEVLEHRLSAGFAEPLAAPGGAA